MAQNFNFRNRRGLAPIIATLMLVLITAVGGSATYSYTQEIIDKNQISSDIPIESIIILGYDFRDVSELRSHNSIYMKEDSAGIPDGIKSYSERVTIYVQNRGMKNIIIDELRFVGEVYEFSGYSNYLSDYVTNTFPAPQEYVILTSAPDILVASEIPVLHSGKIASLVLGLDSSFKIGRQAMMKFTTENGFLVVKTMPIGSYYDINGINCIAKQEEEGESPSVEACGNSTGGESDSEGGDASNSDIEGGSETGGSTGSDTVGGSSGSGSSGGSQPGVGSGSSGPALSSSG